MNLGSWIVLAIVVAIVALAIRATFFKKKPDACCGGGDEVLGKDLMCNSCSACSDCPAQKNCLQPTIRNL